MTKKIRIEEIRTFLQKIVDKNYEFHLEMYSNCLDENITVSGKDLLVKLIEGMK